VATLSTLDQNALIVDKLDTIIGFLAIRGLENDAAISERLFNLGIADRAIAKVMGITDNAVSIRKSRMKKTKPKLKPAKQEGSVPSYTESN
jgi:hypothetical protein